MVSTDWLSKPRGITKIVGVVLTIIILALATHYNLTHDLTMTSQPSMHGYNLMHIVPAAYFFLYVNYLLGYMLDGSTGKAPMQELVMNALGIFLFVSCAGLAFDVAAKDNLLINLFGSKSLSDAYITYGVFCLLMVVVNVADGFFNFQNRGSS